MASLNFELTGTAELQQRLVEAMATMRQQAAAALYQEAEIEMAESKRRCPVDTGTLRDSGHVQSPADGSDGVSVTMGYGGAAADYAVVVHEDPQGVVPRPGGVGQSKFLESVLRESAPYLLERLAKRMKV